MADKEIFHVLDDGNDDGSALSQFRDGDASPTTKNGLLAITSIDESGNGKLLVRRSEGSGGAAATDGLTSLVAIDPSDDFKYLRVNASGHLIITNEGTKTDYSSITEFTPSASEAEETVVTMNIGAAPGELINDFEYNFSSPRDCKWRVYHVDDVGGTPSETLIYVARNQGDEDANASLSCLNLDTTGGTGQQAIRVKVTQKQGTPQALSVFMCARAE